MLVSPSVRLPASVFIVTHFDHVASLRQQTHMLGYDQRLAVNFFFLVIGTFDNIFQTCFSSVACSITIFCYLFELVSVCLQVKSVCLSLQDSNVLVQRNMLEILLYFFPFAECLVGTHRNTLTYNKN